MPPSYQHNGKGGEPTDTLYCIKTILCKVVKVIASNPLLMFLALIAIGKLVA